MSIKTTYAGGLESGPGDSKTVIVTDVPTPLLLPNPKRVVCAFKIATSATQGSDEPVFIDTIEAGGASVFSVAEPAPSAFVLWPESYKPIPPTPNFETGGWLIFSAGGGSGAPGCFPFCPILFVSAIVRAESQVIYMREVQRTGI